MSDRSPLAAFARGRCTRWGAAVLTAAALAVPLAGPASAAGTGGPDTWEAQAIATGDTGGYPTYRIPALVQLNNGDLLASYDGRPDKGDSPNPNTILQRRSTDGGTTWGPQTIIHEGRPGTDKVGFSDPSYVYDAETDTLFNFHVFSKDTGFAASIDGSDDANRRVMSAEVSVSHDQGVTWEHRSVTAVAKPAGVLGTFATSGTGIQVKNGPYAGRLVQQYAGRFSDGTIKAYSLYSDDHGETWTMGAPTGTRMDENKVVELSDGRLMMNSRTSAASPRARLIAYSEDGGATWTTPVADTTLVDPRNNASIIRKHPDAAAGSREAKELLFSNSADPNQRVAGTVRYSCDDGQTWPVARTYEKGDHSYSQLVALQDGTYGSIYETHIDKDIAYGRFGDAWLRPFCASFAPATGTIGAGATGTVSVTVRNDDTDPLPAGTATAGRLPAGWSAGTADTPALAPGESATIEVPVTVAATQSGGTVEGDVTISAGDYALRGDLTVTVDPGAAPVLGATIVPSRTDTGRDLAERPYTVGEAVPFSFLVTSTANVTEFVVPVAGPFTAFLPPSAGNCRWSGLAAGAAYTCATPRHAVTADDIADGFFVADTTWELSATGATTTRVEVPGGEIDVIRRAPALEASQSAAVADADGDSFAEAGDVVTVTTTARNSGNVRLTGLTGAVDADALAVGAEATGTRTIELTDADIAAGVLEVPAAEVRGSNGSREAVAEAPAISVPLHVVPTFSDVRPGDMFAEEIIALASQGVIQGYPDGTFRPLAPVSRDAMAAFLYRMAGSPKVTPPRAQPFRDVNPETEHYDAIIWAYQQGITTGYPDRTFRPTQPIERGAMAAFVHRYAGAPEISAQTAPFSDVAATDPFAAEIAWAKSEGITTGYPDGTYRPTATMNRDATASFLYRMSEEQGITFRSEG